MIEAGQVVYIKTTQEPVFVLKLELNDGKQEAWVRRPVQGQFGIDHRQEKFTLVELETDDERDARELESYTKRHQLATAASQKAQTSAKAVESVN